MMLQYGITLLLTEKVRVRSGIQESHSLVSLLVFTEQFQTSTRASHIFSRLGQKIKTLFLIIEPFLLIYIKIQTVSGSVDIFPLNQKLLGLVLITQAQ